MVRMVVMLALATVLAGCGTKEQKEGTDMPQQDIMAVVDEHAPRLIAIDGVEGIAVGQLAGGEPCVRIYVRELTDGLLAQLPTTLGGHPVDIEESGEFKPLAE